MLPIYDPDGGAPTPQRPAGIRIGWKVAFYAPGGTIEKSVRDTFRAAGRLNDAGWQLESEGMGQWFFRRPVVAGRRIDDAL